MATVDLEESGLFRQRCYLNGAWRDAATGAVREVTNPANGAVLGTVPDMGREDTERAIAAAADAFARWRNRPAAERGAILYRWYELMLAHQDDLGRLMTLEQGKPLPEAKGEIAYAASFLQWFAEEAKRAYGDTIPAARPGQHILVIKQPVGVCAAMTTLKAGDGLEEGVNQSALINQAAVDKVDEHLQDALAGGARLVCGGGTHPLGGSYVNATLLTDVKPDSLVCREETFGPLAAVLRFRTEEEAIALANDTPYGLSAYFYSRDIHRIWRVAEALEAGMIGINEGIISNAAAPFGGVKESGLGREGSRYGMEEYLELKYLCMA